MKKFVSILLVIIMCLSYHFILVVHASTLDAKSDSAVMQEGKSTQAQADKPDNKAEQARRMKQTIRTMQLQRTMQLRAHQCLRYHFA